MLHNAHTHTHIQTGLGVFLFFARDLQEKMQFLNSLLRYDHVWIPLSSLLKMNCTVVSIVVVGHACEPMSEKEGAPSPFEGSASCERLTGSRIPFKQSRN